MFVVLSAFFGSLVCHSYLCKSATWIVLISTLCSSTESDSSILIELLIENVSYLWRFHLNRSVLGYFQKFWFEICPIRHSLLYMIFTNVLFISAKKHVQSQSGIVMFLDTEIRMTYQPNYVHLYSSLCTKLYCYTDILSELVSISAAGFLFD